MYKNNSNIPYQTKLSFNNNLNLKKPIKCLTLLPNLSNNQILNSPKKTSNILPKDNIVQCIKSRFNNNEKIYDLPAHSSTLTTQDYTSNKTGVNVKHCRSILELKAKQYAEKKQQQAKFLKQQNIKCNNQQGSPLFLPLQYDNKTPPLPPKCHKYVC